MNNLQSLKGLYLFKDVEELEHIYNSSIGIHQKKNINIQKFLKELKERSKNENISLEYLDTYFSNVSDMLLSFNSFLINVLSYFREIADDDKDIIKEIERFKNFSIDSGNNNSLEKLSFSFANIMKIMQIDCNPLLVKRIRVYEVLIRHTYAHGNLGNLLNFLIWGGNSSFPYVCFNENEDNTARFRILISKEDYNVFISSPEIASTIQKKKAVDVRKKVILLNNQFKNNIHIFDVKKIIIEKNSVLTEVDYIYLIEDFSRIYLKWYGHKLFRNLSFSHLFDKKFKVDFNFDVKQIVFGIQSKREDELFTELNNYIDYESISNDIENFVELLRKATKHILVKNKINELFQESNVLTIDEIKSGLFQYGPVWSYELIENFMKHNFPKIEKHVENITLNVQHEKEITYYKK